MQQSLNSDSTNVRYSLNKDFLDAFFVQKYGNVESTGWSPRLRYESDYYLPGDIYEALVSKMVEPGMRWIDVGGGNAIFPHNEPLSSELAQRSSHLAAIDPSPNVHENPYASEKVQCLLEDYQTESQFDIATFRMVVEHVENPDLVLKKLSEIMKPGSHVVIYTVNKFSPIPIVAKYTPYWSHFKIIKFITGGGGEQRHIFPVCYKMNTQKTLHEQFDEHGFSQDYFCKLDDVSTTINMRLLHKWELRLRKLVNVFGVRYPEYNLLGVYVKR